MKPIIWAAILTLFCLSDGFANTGPEDKATTEGKAWEKAEEAFVHYITPELERLRKKLNDRHIQYAEIRGKLLSKYLPDLRLYVIDSTLVSSSRIFFVDKTGNIFDLGFGVWVLEGEPGTPGYLPKITEFLASRKLKAKTKEKAIEIAQLIEHILYAPQSLWFLRYHTQNYKVFDKDLLQGHFSRSSNWHYSAEKNAHGWTVSVKYVGPPASIMAPPTYQLEANEAGEFTDITMIPLCGPVMVPERAEKTP